MQKRHYSPLDQLLISADQALKTLFGHPTTTSRSNPASQYDDTELSEQEQTHIAKLMRINHTGEVCAQALYQGQALSAKLPDIRTHMEKAAMEENDHLNWCETRIHELNGRKSILNPLWYASSFSIGVIAGALGDKWSLGFVAETEHQVDKHLKEHLQQIPENDEKTRAILQQMRMDEQSHADIAEQSGAAALPWVIQASMKISSQVMTKTVYWV